MLPSATTSVWLNGRRPSPSRLTTTYVAKVVVPPMQDMGGIGKAESTYRIPPRDLLGTSTQNENHTIKNEPVICWLVVTAEPNGAGGGAQRRKNSS